METFGIEQQQKLDRNIKENVFTRLGVTKPYTVFVCIAVIIILGVFAFSTLKMELFPKMNLPYAVIVNSVPDTTPGSPEDWRGNVNEKVGGNIVRDITQMYSRMQEESLLMLVPNVKNVTRMSMYNGMSTVFIELTSGSKVNMTAIAQALDQVDYYRPFAGFDMNWLTEDMLDEIREGLGESFGPEWKNAPIEIINEAFKSYFKDVEFSKPIIMELSPDMMPVFVLTSTYKADTIHTTESKRFYTQTVEPALKQAKGVANVEISLPTSTSNDFAMIDGQQAVTITVYKANNAVTTETVAAIISALDTIGKDTNGGFKYEMTLNQGQFIKNSVGDVLFNLIIGGILAVVIIFLFMRSWKMTLAVAISIPLSVVGAFVLMYFMGIGLNVVSMSGLALVVGLLVDNSVIVMENISRLRAKGLPIREAAIKGASQILNAVISATLTTLAVFIPMFFVSGLMIEIFMDMIWVMIFALFASLVVAVAFLPAIMSSFGIGEKRERKIRWIAAIGNFFHRIDRSIANFFKKPKAITHKYYNKILNTSIRYKWATLCIAVLLFAGSTCLVFINGFILMPPMDTGEFGATVTLNGNYDPGTAGLSGSKTAQDLAKELGGEKIGNTFTPGVVQKAIGNNDVKHVAVTYSTGSGLSALFSGGGSSLEIDIVLKDNHKKSTSEATQDVYKALVTYLETEGYYPPDNGKAGTEFLVRGVTTSASMNAMASEEVVVTLSAQSQSKLEDAINHVEDKLWETFYKTSPTGEIISDVIKIENSFSNAVINHKNKRIIASLTLTIKDGVSVSKVQNRVDAEMNKMFVSGPDRHEDLVGVTIVPDGFSAQFNDTVPQLFMALLIGLALIYLIMVAMFQSFKMPFIVMITVPLAFTGGFALLAACGMPLSIVAIVGLMILMGVIINNGIVMIDYINKARHDDGLNVRDAVIAGANVRARPILITALSTIFAMIPLALGLGASGGMMAPLAIVSIGGLVYATFMSLLVVPAFYMIFVKDKKSIKIIKEENNEKSDCSQLENEQDKGTGAPVLPRVRRKKS